MNTIQDLEIDRIGESYLVRLEEGFTIYRRAVGAPLDFRYNDTTFTTKVEPERRQWGPIAANSGNCCMITTVRGAYAETLDAKDRKLYEVVVIKTIDRILDLDKVCEEQGIERQYLHVYDTADGRDREKERELFQLYGKQIQEKRIHGIRYRSRRLPIDTCFMFYDTLPNLNEHLSYKEIPDQDISIVRNLVDDFNLLGRKQGD
jgi:hypothetical protein